MILRLLACSVLLVAPHLPAQDARSVTLRAAIQVAAPAPAVGIDDASEAADARQQLRERILARAREYAEFEWRGDPRNVLHGADADGIHVDTPDVSFDPRGWPVDGTPHRGMPYAWGGFTSIDAFRAGLAEGRPAGHVPTSERAQPSARALGLDCSGYVARCWDVPVKQSTRSLGALCYPLPDYDALQPADILNLFDGHVVIFERWLDTERTRMSVYEAARLGVVRSEHAAATLRSQGFVPMRYKPLDERWQSMDVDAPTFSVRPVDGSSLPPARTETAHAPLARGRFVPDAAADPRADASDVLLAALAALPSPLDDARPREWTRHAVTVGEGDGATSLVQLSLVALADGPRVEIQIEKALDGGTIATGTQLQRADVLLDALLDFAASDEALGQARVRDGSVIHGRYELAGRSFAALRIAVRLDATRVVRHQEFPARLDIECVLSQDVPVHGVLHARVIEETVWHDGPPGERSSSRWVRQWDLTDFGGDD